MSNWLIENEKQIHEMFDMDFQSRHKLIDKHLRARASNCTLTSKVLPTGYHQRAMLDSPNEIYFLLFSLAVIRFEAVIRGCPWQANITLIHTNDLISKAHGAKPCNRTFQTPAQGRKGASSQNAETQHGQKNDSWLIVSLLMDTLNICLQALCLAS